MRHIVTFHTFVGGYSERAAVWMLDDDDEPISRDPKLAKNSFGLSQID